ncbi:hypothetical protein GMYAFLOJ_CDS0055 [Microbacterium phage phiMiGM15]
MSSFTPTHRVKTEPFYRFSFTPARQPQPGLRVGETVMLRASDSRPDAVGDVQVARQDGQFFTVNTLCLEPLPADAVDPVPAPTIRREALIAAARDAGLDGGLAEVIADAAERRSQ